MQRVTTEELEVNKYIMVQTEQDDQVANRSIVFVPLET